MKKYKTYIEKKRPEYFEVFIIHGSGSEWEDVFDIVEDLNFKALELSREYNSISINEKVRDAIFFKCNCAIVIITPDDLINHRPPKSKKTNKYFNTRPNVLYEMGLVHGLIDHRFGLELETEPLLILRQEELDIPSDLHGLEFMSFKKGQIKKLKPRIKTTLEKIYKEIKAYYEE